MRTMFRMMDMFLEMDNSEKANILMLGLIGTLVVFTCIAFLANEGKYLLIQPMMEMLDCRKRKRNSLSIDGIELSGIPHEAEIGIT